MIKPILLIFSVLLFSSLFAQPPEITSINPGAGPIGSTVTITGKNFNVDIANNVVYFGGIKSPVILANSTSLKVTVPVGATYQPISVLNTSTGLQAFSALPFLSTFNEGSLKPFTSESFSSTTIEDFSSGFETSLQLADIDGDSKLDLVLVDVSQQLIKLYRNTSVTGSLTPGSFTLSATFAVTPTYLLHQIKGVNFADLDGDGKLDMFVPYLAQNKVAVYKNVSIPGVIQPASFATKLEFISDSSPYSTTSADLNGDGKPEIITSNLKSSVSILVNIAIKGGLNSSSFVGKQDFPMPSDAYTVQAGDMDADGKPDLLIGRKGGITLLKNTSTTGSTTLTFTTTEIPLTTTEVYFSYLADMNEDTKPDVVVMSRSTPGITIYKNTSSGAGINFETPIAVPTRSQLLHSIYIDDINGDAKPDILISGQEYYSVIPNTTAAGSLLFGNEVILPASTFYRGPIISGDIDGDGKKDILATNASAHLLHNDIIGLPEITSFSPSSAKKGETITITGKNLSNALEVSFGGAKAASIKVESERSIIAIVDTGITGDVLVLTRDGSGSKPGFTYISPPPPQITSFSPTSAIAGTEVTITGVNLSSVLEVRFGSIPATWFKANSPTSIVASVGSGETGSITVITKYGKTVLPGFICKPHNILFSPEKAKPGEKITITGTGLSGATAVNFGGIPATAFTVISASKIVAFLGEGESGKIEVITPSGEAISTRSLQLDIPNVIITDFYPKKAKAGETVTFTGSNFSMLPAGNSVYFGTAKAMVIKGSVNELMVKVPAGASYDLISVSVGEPEGYRRGIAYSKVPFILTSPKTAITPTSFGNKYIVTEGTTMTIGDSNGDGMPDVVHDLGQINAGHASLDKNTSVAGELNFSPELTLNTMPKVYKHVDLSTVNGEITTFFALSDNFGESYYHTILFGPPIRTTSLKSLGRGYGVDIAVADMDGDGRFDPVAGVLGVRFSNVCLADLDGDGKQDIIERNTSKNTISIYRNISTLSNIAYAEKVDITVQGEPTSVSAGDFDGDEKLDLAVTSVDVDGISGVVTILKNHGTTGNIAFLKVNDFICNNLPRRTCINDVNGDGNVDLLVCSGTKTSIYTNKFNGGIISFSAKVDFELDGRKKIMVCDFDVDGRPDLIGLGEDENIVILKNLHDEPLITFFPPDAFSASTITITGANFNDVTEVTFDGVAAKSFKVISPNTITATLPNPLTHNRRVSMRIVSSNGVGKVTGFRILHTPTITPRGAINFATGGNVVLEANQSGWVEGAPIQWSKDGVEIPGAQSLVYTATESGEYTLSITVNNERLTSPSVFVYVIGILPNTNFQITTNQITCLGNNDGSITINAKEMHKYKSTVIGGDLNTSYQFENDLVVNNLKPGLYKVCINIEGSKGPDQCYTLTLSEPKALSVYSYVNHGTNTLTLQLEGGSSYFITLNGKLYTTSKGEITIPLEKGNVKILVTTDKACQGKTEKSISFSEEVSIFPNPFESNLTLDIGKDQTNQIGIQIYKTDGTTVLKKEYLNRFGIVSLDLSDLNPTTLYILKLSLDSHESFYKIFKK